MPERTYNEEEVADVLRRAAELQASPESPTGGSTEHALGLTLEELAAIAADAGLDPANIRIAASEIDRRGRKKHAVSRATSSEILAERWVSGLLDDEAREGIVAELRHRFDASDALGMRTSFGKSRVEAVGRSLEWQHVHPWYGTQRRVLVQPRKDAVRIRVTQNNPYAGSATGWTPLYAPMFALIAGALAAPALGSFALTVLVALLTLAASWPLLVFVSRRSREAQRREIDLLADDIARYLTPLPAGPGLQAADGPLATTQSSPVAPETPLDAQQESAEEQASPGRLRTQ